MTACCGSARSPPALMQAARLLAPANGPQPCSSLVATQTVMMTCWGLQSAEPTCPLPRSLLLASASLRWVLTLGSTAIRGRHTECLRQDQVGARLQKEGLRVSRQARVMCLGGMLLTQMHCLSSQILAAQAAGESLGGARQVDANSQQATQPCWEWPDQSWQVFLIDFDF